MNNAKKVDQFIREMFKTYSLTYGEFFEDSDDLTEAMDSEENDEIVLNMSMVDEAAKILGVERSDILNTDSEKTMKWFKKYPYFWHKTAFDHAYRRSFHDKNYDILRLMEVLYEKPIVPTYPTRYDYKSVKARLVELLKSMDEAVPGTYHPNATMENLCIQTENFCHFDDIAVLVETYIEMVDRAKTLFLKAWDVDLSGEEIREYNFLVATIGIQDKFYHSHEYLFYDLLKAFVPVYRDEGEREFFSFVQIHPHRVLQPWKCAEFSLNKDLVQKFVDIYPAAKKEMREFSLKVSKFLCFFTWSDAESTVTTQTELDEINQIAAILGEKPRTFDDYKESTSIYVPKTKAELDGEEMFAERLRVLSGPMKLGGVQMRSEAKIDRMRARVQAAAKVQKKEGDLHE